MLLKDYDPQIQRHPEKENVVADALSRNSQHSLSAVVINHLNLLRGLKNWYSISVTWASK